MKALLVDDEPLLNDYLNTLLADVWPELDVVATARTGAAALAAFATHQPDVVFLDIQMPGMSGLEVARQLAGECHIVFVTAFDRYAVDAFERDAIDYLLKPVSADRLMKTRERITSADKSPPIDAALLESVLQRLAPKPRYLEWIRAGLDDDVELVQVSDVVYFRADAKYTSVFTPEKELIIRTPIKELEEQLDPAQFWRVHRGIIVNVQDVAKARRDLRGRYNLTLRRRRETLRTSTAYGHLFKQM